jgi:phosphatidylinositol alpha-mannosyltransferase
MRVLLTTPYDLAVPGGVNRHALGLLDHLTGRGMEARLVGPSSVPNCPDDPRIILLGGVRTGRLNGARSRVTLDLGLGAEVRRLVGSFRPDVLHLQEPFIPTLNTFALLHAGGARRVGTFHTFSESSRGYLWTWPWCRWINSLLDARIAVSEPARSFATRYHPAPFVVIPHAVRLPPESAMRPRRAPGRPARVLFVGRADEPRKGFSVLADAMRLMNARYPGEFAVDAVGPGTVRGGVGEGELMAAFAAADVCAVPSIGGESFGLVALEALAHGVPVVASRIRGYAEWLDGSGTGDLVAPGDPVALSEALLRILRDSAFHGACAERARGLAELYSWDRCAQRLGEVYAGGNP